MPKPDENSEAKSADTSADKPNIKPEEFEALRKENERLKGTVQSFQKKQEEFETFKKEIERKNMSEADRIKAEIEEQKADRLKAETRAKELEAQLQTQKLVNELVADHGLTNPEFGEVIVRKFDPTKEDFADFAKRMAAESKYKAAFTRVGTTEKGDSGPRSPAPPGPTGGSSRNKAPGSDEQEQRDREWARQRYPGDEARQKSMIERLKNERTRRKE